MSGGLKPVNPDVTTKSFPICCSRANASADATNCTICDCDTWPVGRYSAWSPIILKYCNSLIGILASCRLTLHIRSVQGYPLRSALHPHQGSKVLAFFFSVSRVRTHFHTLKPDRAVYQVLNQLHEQPE